MKIILDFDDTIFNTYQLFQELIKIFQGAGFTEEEFKKKYRETKNKAGGFELETILRLSRQLKSFDEEKVRKEIDSLVSDAEKFVYPDLADFTESFDKKNLVLLSCGETNFQREKIEKSKIASFFNKIIISPTEENKTDNLKNIFQKNCAEKIFFIDDKAEQIDRIKKDLPQIIVLKMERPQGKHKDIKSELADYVVKDLYEAREVILENVRS